VATSAHGVVKDLRVKILRDKKVQELTMKWSER